MAVKKELRKTPFTLLLSQYVAESGMKLNAIASAAGITYVYLNRLLNETRHPSEQVVLSLAKALRLSLEQTGAFLAAAGYAPALALLPPSAVSVPQASVPSATQDSQATRLAQRFYRLALEIPETLQGPFLHEIEHLFGYARYKYLLCSGTRLTDLRFTEHTFGGQKTHAGVDISSLDTIATLVAELWNGEPQWQGLPRAKAPSQVEDMLNSIDQLTGSVLAGEVSEASYQPHLVKQIREALRQGVPWEIRRRVTEALPGIGKFDAPEACQIAASLRLDRDEKYGVDIRRRVVETLVPLFEANPSSFPTIIDLLRPRPSDDIYVALATVEACADIQTKMKALCQQQKSASSREPSLLTPLPPEQTEVLKIQRQLLSEREAIERECLQFFLALYDLLCTPETLLLSVQEGLHSPEKLLQLVAARYLERLLPVKPVESLQLYKLLLDRASSRNVRRTVVRAFPSLLRCLQEGSLPMRTLTRTLILLLASDSDLHIRRTVADYALQLFQIDREFLLTILLQLHQDRDQAIRHRLQPVALRLAEVWLIWYAETAGLVQTTKRTSTPSFGE